MSSEYAEYWRRTADELQRLRNGTTAFDGHTVSIGQTTNGKWYIHRARGHQEIPLSLNRQAQWVVSTDDDVYFDDLATAVTLAHSGTPLPIIWTDRLAKKFIGEHQQWAMDNGYYIALAGGVLNNGSSQNDLDLVFVPRWERRQMPNFPLLFDARLSHESAKNRYRTGLHLKYPTLQVEALIIHAAY